MHLYFARNRQSRKGAVLSCPFLRVGVETCMKSGEEMKALFALPTHLLNFRLLLQFEPELLKLHSL